MRNAPSGRPNPFTQEPDTLARELIDTVRRINGRGWCDGTSGNYSVVVSRDPLRLLITPSGADKGRVDTGDLLVVGADGRVLEDTPGRPSAETPIHIALVRVAGAGAVLHTHSVWGTLLGEHFLTRGEFTLRGYEMLKGIDGVTSHDAEVDVPIVANTQDMAALSNQVAGLVNADPGLRAFLIAGHGLYVWGRDVVQASRHVEIFEFLLQLVGRRVRLEPFDE